MGSREAFPPADAEAVDFRKKSLSTATEVDAFCGWEAPSAVSYEYTTQPKNFVDGVVKIKNKI